MTKKTISYIKPSIRKKKLRINFFTSARLSNSSLLGDEFKLLAACSNGICYNEPSAP